MWPLSGSGKWDLAVLPETSVAVVRMTFPPPERKYFWREYVALKRSNRTQKGRTIWNKCKDRHEQKREKLMSEVNEMDADGNQAGELKVAVA